MRYQGEKQRGKGLIYQGRYCVRMVIQAMTTMQAVPLCKRTSKPSDPLDRDPTVGHI